MANIFNKTIALIKAFVKYCPYCLAGKKVVQVASRKKNCDCEKKTALDKTEENMITGIKTGRNIALVGVFCPFFWISVLTGSSIQTIQFNAIHSGIVILIGLAIASIYRFNLGRIRKRSTSIT
ncbi:MAG: hypothetical protein N2645_19880 [Clostridia bacterium]|nr:hypothetical protein [Clostridia bacterium]